MHSDFCKVQLEGDTDPSKPNYRKNYSQCSTCSINSFSDGSTTLKASDRKEYSCLALFLCYEKNGLLRVYGINIHFRIGTLLNHCSVSCAMSGGSVPIKEGLTDTSAFRLCH